MATRLIIMTMTIAIRCLQAAQRGLLLASTRLDFIAERLTRKYYLLRLERKCRADQLTEE